MRPSGASPARSPTWTGPLKWIPPKAGYQGAERRYPAQEPRGDRVRPGREDHPHEDAQHAVDLQMKPACGGLSEPLQLLADHLERGVGALVLGLELLVRLLPERVDRLVVLLILCEQVCLEPVHERSQLRDLILEGLAGSRGERFPCEHSRLVRGHVHSCRADVEKRHLTWAV